jgi:hypothetical protein
MKLYLLKQNDNNDYDTYDSCVVCAENALDAITIHPQSLKTKGYGYPTWPLGKELIICVEIGDANDKQERGVIIASFNAS